MLIGKCGQLVYGVVSIIAVVLIIASMFTTSWNNFKDIVETGEVANVKNNAGIGLLTFCSFPDDRTKECFCKSSWTDIDLWQKIVAISMSLGLLFAVMSLVYNAMTFFMCCIRQNIYHPLVTLTTLAGICLAIAVCVFGYNHKNYLVKFHDMNIFVEKPIRVSYSFWLAFGAMLMSFGNIIPGILIFLTADRDSCKKIQRK